MVPNQSLLREQLQAIRQQLKALQDQVDKIQVLVDPQPSPGLALSSTSPEAGAVPLPAQEVLADCAKDILQVLQKAGHPLSTLEILDELVRRDRHWGESTASHTLAHLIDHSVVRMSSENGGHKFGLRAPT